MRRILLSLVLLLSTPALSDEVSDCMPDCVRLCREAIQTMDKDKVIACLVHHKAQLKAECKRHVHN